VEDSTHYPSPRITGEADGTYTSTCPVCGDVTHVVVTNVPFINAAGVQAGETAEFDMTAYEKHYDTEHRGG
jgi:hypothetical protein